MNLLRLPGGAHTATEPSGHKKAKKNGLTGEFVNGICLDNAPRGSNGFSGHNVKARVEWE